MTKLVETEIPDWAEWMAQDEDGRWHVYSHRPKMHGNLWDPSDFINHKWLMVGESGKSNNNWRDTLYKLEKK